MRTFLAIEIDEYIKDRINETQNTIEEKTSSRIKYVEIENIHLTLKFFGEINEKQLTSITEKIEKTIEKYEEYPLKIVNVGAFPNIYRPKVIWTGIKDKNITTKLIKELDEEFNQLGFKKEKNYIPHITIGRVKQLNDNDDLTSILKNMKKEYHGKMIVKKICLKSSQLTPEGPIYKTINEFKLGE